MIGSMLRSMCSSLVALLVLSALLPARSDAQPEFGRVSGTVLDPLGDPAEQLLVTLAGGDPDREQSTRTDARGQFTISNVPPGNYWLLTPATDDLRNNAVTVATGSDLRLDVQLQQDETVVELTLCRDCRPDAAASRATAVQQPRDELSAAVMSSAEPEEGWERFNQRTFEYPTALRAAGVEGAVVIHASVDAEGTTRDIVVMSSSDERLTGHAIDTVSPLRWKPAMIHAKPVDSPLRVTLEFRRRVF